MEYLCNVCNGKGKLFDTELCIVTVCYHCWGYKKLNWIENVFGIQSVYNDLFFNQEGKCIKINEENSLFLLKLKYKCKKYLNGVLK